MSLYSHAVREMDLIGLNDGDEMNGAMRSHILHMMEEFTKEGHSGFSANYAISLLSKLLKYEPLSPITGEDSEWVEIAKEVSGTNHGTLYQNNRCGRIFKDDTGAYDVEGKVFYEWYTDEETGEKYKTYFTSIESRVPVTFPYTPVTVYEERLEGV